MNRNILKIFNSNKDCAFILISVKFSNKLSLTSLLDLYFNKAEELDIYINPIFTNEKSEFNLSFKKEIYNIKNKIDFIRYLNKFGFWGLKGDLSFLENNSKKNFLYSKKEFKKLKLISKKQISICIL